MKRIQTLFFLLLLFSLCSCEVVYFDKPQPVDKRDQKIIPKQLRGEVLNDENKILITKEGIEIIDDFSPKRWGLSDSLKLRKSGGSYFFNCLDENGWWRVFNVREDFNHVIGVFEIKHNDLLLLKDHTFLEYIMSTSDNVIDEKYFKGSFNSKEINEFVLKGGFSDTIFVFPADSLKDVRR